MSDTNQEDYSSIERHIKLSLWVGGILIAVVLGIYILNFWGSLNKDPEKWGPFGDYLGGTLNPILAALAFYWLTASIRLQIQELRETKIELRKAAEAQEKSERHQRALAELEDENVQTQKQILSLQRSILESQQETAYAQQQQISKQNFENLFFELIKTKNEALKEITATLLTHDGETTIYGTRVLQNILSEFRQGSTHLISYYPKSMEYKLSSYNRICENILELIFSNKERVNSSLKYENIFTSTLTQLELTFLLYSGIFNKRLKYLLEELSALEALDFEYDCRVSRSSDLTKYAFLYKSVAFGNNEEWISYFKDFDICNFDDIEIKEIKTYKEYLSDILYLTYFNDKNELEYGSFDRVKGDIENKIIELNRDIEDVGLSSGDIGYQKTFNINTGKLINELDKLEKIKLTHELYVTMKYNLDLEKTLKLILDWNYKNLIG